MPNIFPFTHPGIILQPTDLRTGKPFGIDNNYGGLGQTNLGVPSISWITFKNFIVNGQNVPLQISECLITVSQKPRIIKTYCVGKDGSIPTYIGLDDYEIEIEGFIFNVNADGTSAANMEGIYPNTRVTTLLRALAQQGQTYGLNVQCPKLDLFGDSGIDYIIITKLEIPEEEGQYSQQKFTINAISNSLNDGYSIYSPYNA
jgi:hypothetical protein